MAKQPCPACSGSGRTRHVVDYRGKVATRHCWECSGTGEVDATDA